MQERIKMIKAMEYIARSLDSEDVLFYWLANGVPDGLIEDGDLSSDGEGLEGYTDDDILSDLMTDFLHVMNLAAKDGGLYCDGVSSK